MPVKRKLNKKRTKVPRNVKINQKGSKRVSQKKRGRKMSKRQRGGEVKELGQWSSKRPEIKEQSIDSYNHLKTYVPKLIVRLEEMLQPKDRFKSECLTLARELLEERNEGTSGFFTVENREKCLNDPNFILDGKDADGDEFDSDYKDKNFVTIVDECFNRWTNSDDVNYTFFFLYNLFARKGDRSHPRDDKYWEDNKTKFSFNWRAFKSLLVTN